MTQLIEKTCKACEGGVEPLDRQTSDALLKECPGWEISADAKSIERKFSFRSFYPVMNFVNAVAYIAQKEGHHPDMQLGYNYCNITFTTHAIDGLSENDFICAAKINALL